ncbi:MAG: hypothetical protein K0R39_3100 [Symbiobacteriaceae bacterium]|nr:hypothetical protein [Symbiobacteriaceae bacterium]
MQEAFTQTFQVIGQLREPEAFRSWLYRLTVRRAWQEAARERTHIAAARRLASLPETAASPFDEAERRRLVDRLIKDGLTERAAEVTVPADAWEQQKALLMADGAPAPGVPHRPWWRRWALGAEVAVSLILTIGLVAVGRMHGPQPTGDGVDQVTPPPMIDDLNPLAPPPVPRVVLAPDLPAVTPPEGSLPLAQIIDAAVAEVSKDSQVRGGQLTLSHIALVGGRWELSFQGDGRAYSFSGGPAPIDSRKGAYSHVVPLREITLQLTPTTGEIYGARVTGAPLAAGRTDLEHYRGYIVSGGQQTTLRLVRADGGREGRDLVIWVPGQALKESGLDLWHLNYGTGRLIDVWGLTTAPREVLAYRIEMKERPDEALLVNDLIHGIPVPDGAQANRGIRGNGERFTLEGHTVASLAAWYAEQMPEYGWEVGKPLTPASGEAKVLRFVILGWQAAEITILPDPQGVQFTLTWNSTGFGNQEQAVDAVFRDLADDPVFQRFPRTVGAAMGTINIGGPPPGVTIPATFETRVRMYPEGGWEVELVRSWGDAGLHTTWTFRVEQDGVVHHLGQSGDQPPAIP